MLKIKMKKLYKHQKKQNKEVLKALKQDSHIIYGAATGFGKSVALMHLIAKDLKKGRKVLVLAPYRKLIFQLEKTFNAFEPHVIMGTIDRGSKDSGLVLSSLDTMNARMKKDSPYFEGFHRIYIDEVHIGGAKRMVQLYDKYWNNPMCKWVGFTATPINAKGYRLEGWDKTIYRYQTRHLIDMGFLADYDYYAPEHMDLSKLRVSSIGEYVNEDVDEVVSTPTAVGSVKKNWKLFGKGKKCIIFAASIKHAELLKKAIPDTYIIHSKVNDLAQQKLLEEFAQLKEGTIINVSMLTIGFDDPSVEVLIYAKPMRSIPLAIQCAGRCLRLFGDKRATIVDLTNVYENAGLPKDIRDFNRVKKSTDSKKEMNEVAAIQCPHCKEVISKVDVISTKRVTKKMIIVTKQCPYCEEVIDEIRTDLSIVKSLNKIDDIEVIELSHKERLMELEKLIKSVTSANTKWAYYILKDIKANDKNDMFDELIGKLKAEYWKPKTIFKKIMELKDSNET